MQSIGRVQNLNGDARRLTPEIVFSLCDGYVWVSWLGSPVKVRLGEYEPVTTMMQDFLAHSELASRLAGPKCTDSGADREE